LLKPSSASEFEKLASRTFPLEKNIPAAGIAEMEEVVTVKRIRTKKKEFIRAIV